MSPDLLQPFQFEYASCARAHLAAVRAGATGHSGKSLAGATDQSDSMDPLMTVAFINIVIMESAFECKNAKNTSHL